MGDMCKICKKKKRWPTIHNSIFHYFQELLTIPEDLAILEEASKTTVESLGSEVNQLDNQIKKIANQMKQAQDDVKNQTSEFLNYASEV